MSSWSIPKQACACMRESGGERGTCRDRVSYTRIKEISRWSIVQPDKMRIG